MKYILSLKRDFTTRIHLSHDQMKLKESYPKKIDKHGGI